MVQKQPRTVRALTHVAVLQEGLFEASGGSAVARGLLAADPALEHKGGVSGRRDRNTGRKDEYGRDWKIRIRYGHDETTGARVHPAGHEDRHRDTRTDTELQTFMHQNRKNRN